MEILPYSIDTLINVIADNSNASKDAILTKYHIIYFKKYFIDLDAKTILVEKNYIDRDYLIDYSAYYVRCFEQIKDKCTRLHFFNFSFISNDFEHYLKNPENESFKKKLEDGYLGFIVIKPLPYAVIGRTCLKTYNDDNNRRKFPVVREYLPNLYGINLKINTLAFQEQDQVVAACATSSLWTVFHGTGMIFQHEIKSPSEITRIASSVVSEFVPRTFPNIGLTGTQMVHVIRQMGLDPIARNAQNDFLFKSMIYAYLKCKIPIILLTYLYDSSNPQADREKHAVAITGYSISDKQITPIGDDNFSTISSRINKIYAHDDQIGPFARMEFDNPIIIVENGKEVKYNSLSTSWPNEEGNQGCIFAIPDMIFIPLYHKIRVPLEVILQSLIVFNKNLIEEIKTKGFIEFSGNINWDVYLITLNDFKSIMFDTKFLSEKYRYSLLTEELPHYLWRAVASVDDFNVFELIFDATSIEQGELFLRAVEYEPLFAAVIRSVSSILLNQFAEASPIWQILKWFSDRLEFEDII